MGGISFILTVVGFGLTWLGLKIAYQQLKSTKTAAEEAALAVTGVRLQLTQYEAAQDVARAMQSLDHARAEADPGNWQAVGKNYEEVRRCFIRLDANLTDEDGEAKVELQKAAKQINIILKTIDGIADDGPTPERAKILDNIRRHIEISSRLQVFIHGKAF